jgi:glycosyltransferase involved in cell wall biosynthesis
MRVIHVVPTPFGPGGGPGPARRLLGGGERYPLELARALARHIECELITFGPEAREDQDAENPLLRIRTLRSIAYLHGHPARPMPPALPAAVWNADIVHAHHMRSTPSVIAALTARLHGRRAVVTDHGLQGSDWGGLLYGLFDRFLTVSAYSARELGAPSERTAVIHGGADPARFAPDPHAVHRGILFVGRITPHKGIDRLIEALPEGASLTIAGSEGHDAEWPEREYPELLRRLAARSPAGITFLGPVADRDLPALYRQAAVLVLPSVECTIYGRSVRVSELLGLVLLEAMMSGTPVVASALGGIPEIVQDGTTGFLVEPGDTGELRDRLSQILRDPALAERMGRAAHELARERFTWDACAARCLTAYESLGGSGRAPVPRHRGSSRGGRPVRTRRSRR